MIPIPSVESQAPRFPATHVALRAAGGGADGCESTQLSGPSRCGEDLERQARRPVADRAIASPASRRCKPDRRIRRVRWFRRLDGETREPHRAAAAVSTCAGGRGIGGRHYLMSGGSPSVTGARNPLGLDRDGDKLAHLVGGLGSLTTPTFEALRERRPPRKYDRRGLLAPFISWHRSGDSGGAMVLFGY